MKNLVIFFALVLFVFPTRSSAQSASPTSAPSPSLPNARQFYQENFQEKGNYLGTLLGLQRREAEYLASPEHRYFFLEYVIMASSFLGASQAAYAYEDKLLADFDVVNKTRARNAAELTKAPLENFKARSALDAISSAADKNQIVIINEEHRHPVHRALTHRLLANLYAKGFRYLAVETLIADDTDLNRRGYPTNKSGYYTLEPVFGDVIRQAIKLGFKTVAYENPKPCPKPTDRMFCDNERELNQAQNVYDRILKNDPQAKILMHAGRGHAAKVKYGDLAMMAWHLRAISGIEPFTVDQLAFSPFYNSSDESPLYRYVTKNGLLLAEPTVFESPENKFYSRSPEVYNLSVFTPRAKYFNGRPDWLALGGARREHRPDLKKLKLKSEKGVYKAGAPVLVQTFIAGESADAVPIDQIVLYPEKEISVLVLPAGSFEIKAVDETKKVVGQYKVKIK